MSLKYAIIGCGRISPNHVAAAIDNKLDIVALCDLDDIKIDDTLRNFKLSEQTKKYKEYKDMINNEDIDLIAICTESGNHASIALDCIAKGIHLIIEKPIALSLEDVDKMIEMAKLNNVKISSCHQNRFNKSIQKIREAIEANRFGKLMHGTAHVRWNRKEEYYTQAPW